MQFKLMQFYSTSTEEGLQLKLKQLSQFEYIKTMSLSVFAYILTAGEFQCGHISCII